MTSIEEALPLQEEVPINKNVINDNNIDNDNYDQGSESVASLTVKSINSKAGSTTSTIPSASFGALFQFATTQQILIFLLGCFFCITSSATLPAINIIFGDIIDSIAEPVNVQELVTRSAKAMALLGVYGFVTFFFSFWCCGYAASEIANGWRTQYLETMFRQEMAFFDNAEPGSLTLMLSDSAMEIQSGLAEKWAQAMQGIFQFIFGFALAFYFGPELAAVLLGCVPILAMVTLAMFMWGSEDGIFGKEAYASASTIVNETIGNIRTIAALNAEPTMSQRYDAKLVDSEKAAIRQGTRTAVLGGLLFFVVFGMYGLGFWYGAKLIADSTDAAMRNHPPNDDLLDPNSPLYPIIQVGCSKYIQDEDIEALEVCACGLPWETLGDLLDDNVVTPNCGCGYEQTAGEDLGVRVLSGCMSGGRVMMVFFSILIGGFSIGQVGPGVKALGEAKQAAAKMLQVIERKPLIGDEDDDDDDNNNKKHDNSEKTRKKRLKREDVKGELVLEDVHFQYNRPPDDGDDNNNNNNEHNTGNTAVVFGGCNLTMKAGETIALVGASGCGKSTIAKLVQRFYDPTDGRILLDGTDLRDIHVGDLRSCIGVVSQEPLLFDTTIEENIRYGKPDATHEEIVEAAQSANAHEFIMSFPDGYQTLVGPRGGKLSGGQKQRIAISRAILRDPPILILDEATSALDSKSEKLVQRALDKLIKHEDSTTVARSRTIIVIAHRLSTVRNADTIVVLGSPEGTSNALTGSVILEKGSHDELMNLEKGYYKALVGDGHKSSGLVDDISPRADLGVDGIEMDDISLVDREEINTPDENAIVALDGKAKDEEETEGFFAKIFGKKDSKDLAKEKFEKEELQKNKARVWNYTRPEMGWIVFGSMSSMIKGSILPLLSIVFSEMIIVWYESDTDYMKKKSLEYSFFLYGIALMFLVTETIQKGVFEMIGERITKRLRGDLFRGILRKDIMWFEDPENSVGALASRLSTDVKHVRLVTGQSVASALESASALTTGIIISAMASWQIFLVMIAMVPALGMSEAGQFMAMQSSEGRIRDELSKSTDKLHETIAGIREVQSFSLQRIVIDDIECRIQETISPASRKSACYKGLLMGMIQLIQFGVYACAFWVGGLLVEREKVSFDDFMKALWAMAFAASGLGQAALFAGDVAKASAAVQAIFKTLDFVPTIDSRPWENNGLADMKTEKAVVRQIPNTTLNQGKGELCKVNFAYPTRKTAKVFNAIDLEIHAGKIVALVGSSGSGKSTVVQLLLRFYDPISYKETADGKDGLVEIVVDDGKLSDSNGMVKIDDKDLREEDIRWLRNNMGYVGQEPVLFNDTIYNNIALGKEGCTSEEVEQAAKDANAYDFIVGLENGFDTMVGIGGSKISGGQKQRVAIARALLRQPKILILDEATSALDNKSEKIVQASLERIVKESGGNRTTIIIAHRLSTIQAADVICVLENPGDGSRVVEMGTHDDLMKLNQKYKALVQAYESS